MFLSGIVFRIYKVVCIVETSVRKVQLYLIVNIILKPALIFANPLDALLSAPLASLAFAKSSIARSAIISIQYFQCQERKQSSKNKLIFDKQIVCEQSLHPLLFSSRLVLEALTCAGYTLKNLHETKRELYHQSI